MGRIRLRPLAVIPQARASELLASLAFRPQPRGRTDPRRGRLAPGAQATAHRHVGIEEQLELLPTLFPLHAFITTFRDGLLAAVARDNPAVDATPTASRTAVLDALARRPFAAQRRCIQAALALLVDAGEHAAVINGEMGSGKTQMGIACAAALHAEGYPRTLVLSPRTSSA